MDLDSTLSPSILSRIEILKEWQAQQQRKLIEQQSQQTQFLTKEHRRMYKALGIQQNEKETVTAVELYQGLKKNHSNNHQLSRHFNEDSLRNKHKFLNNGLDDENIEICEDEINSKILKDGPVQSEYNKTKKSHSNRNIDDIPIKSPTKDFTALIEEKLIENDDDTTEKQVRPKKKFLKKGAGLSRFRMTVQDLPYKKPQPKLCLDKPERPPIETKNSTEKKKISSPKRTSNNNKIGQHLESKHNKYNQQPTAEPSKKKSKIQDGEKQEYNFPNKRNKSPVQENKIEPLHLNSEDLILNTKNARLNYIENNNISTPRNLDSLSMWSPTPVQGNKTTDYQALIAELIEVRQRNPAIFDTPSINHTNLSTQQAYDRDVLDELKIFEALEQNAANSSFCSSSSLVTKFMECPIKTTPRKHLNFTALTNGIPEEDAETEVRKLPTSPKRFVKFNEVADNLRTIAQETEEESSRFSGSEESDSESTTGSDSSVNSEDITDATDLKDVKHKIKTIVPTKYKKRESLPENPKSVPVSLKVIYKDVATNTDQPMATSEMLKIRLVELESELSTFRLENARINKLKSQLENDKKMFEKRKRQLDEELEDQKQQMKAQLDEEKRKLCKDRAVYNRYAQEIKEGKSLRQKDREELNILRGQVSQIEEEMKLKEAKWGATQARIRSQLKHLEKTNTALRAENNELRTKNGKLEATNKQLLTRRPSDTKVLHEINKNLTKLAKETQDKDVKDIKDKIKTPCKKITPKINRNSNASSPSADEEYDKENRRRRSSKYVEELEETPRRCSEDTPRRRSGSLNSTNESKVSSEHSFESVEREYEKLFGKTKRSETEENTICRIADASACSDMSARREEAILEDGSKRITYSNGNVKTISPNAQMTVMQYHNGDVKETCKDTGTIRYLYSDTKTWHTTYPDGMEVLEFANGQIEKRFANGSSEILFPNGCQRSNSPRGSEEVTFPDGTVLLTRPSSGEKILTLPNGQREIHTKDHKRREYPDGTVKILYPDGVQETRYANGRIRLKDKQGNLIMDSASV